MSLEIELETYLRGSETLVSRIDLVNSSPSTSVASWGSLRQVSAALGMPALIATMNEVTISCYLTDQLIFTNWHRAADQVSSDDWLGRLSVYAQPIACQEPIPSALRSWYVGSWLWIRREIHGSGDDQEHTRSGR